MLDTLRKMRQLLRSLFGQNVPLAGEWEGIAPERMTPRQVRLQRCSLILLWGALLNFLAVLAICAAAIHAGNRDSSLFTAMQTA